MEKYRVITVPIQGKKDGYRIQIQTPTPSPWWSSKPPTAIWHAIDEYGIAYKSFAHGPTLPPLKLFQTLEKAKKWILDHIEYINKAQGVVYEIEA